MSDSPRPSRTPFTFDRVMRIVFALGGIAVAIVLLDMLEGVLLPFAVACMLAYLLEPAVKWHMRILHLKRRLGAVALTLFETGLAGAVISTALVPYVISETEQMTVMIRNYATTQIEIPLISSQVHEFLRENIDFDAVSKLLTPDQWTELAKRALSSGWKVFSSGVALVMEALGWLVVVLYLVFIMLDYDRIKANVKMLFPWRHRRTAIRIARDIEQVMNRYFRGQLLISVLVGILFAAGFMFIGLPLAIVFGLFVGLLNLVPYLQLISLPIAALLCLMATASSGVGFWAICLQTLAVYAIVQAVQDMLLTPRIMGKAMGLNPAFILLSLSVWGTLLGFMGLIVALPLTTLLAAYYKKYISNPPAHHNAQEQ